MNLGLFCFQCLTISRGLWNYVLDFFLVVKMNFGFFLFPTMYISTRLADKLTIVLLAYVKLC